jgi:hypothetical protein
MANRLAFAWYVVGVSTGAVVNAIGERTLQPLRSVLAGLRALRTDHAGSTFLAPVPERPA